MDSIVSEILAIFKEKSTQNTLKVHKYKHTSITYYSCDSSASDVASRLFGVWNIMSAVVRMGCAWDLNNPT